MTDDTYKIYNNYNEKELKKIIYLKLNIFQIFAMFRRGLFYSYMTVYLRYFIGLSITNTTLFATIPMILNSTFQTFVWGTISDKIKKRKMLIILGEFLAGIFTIFVWFFHYKVSNKLIAGNIIIYGMAFVEIFWSMSNLGWSVYISDVFSESERTIIQTKFTSYGALGRIIGVIFGGFFYNGFGLKYEGWGFYEGSLFFISSLFMFLSVIPLLNIPDSNIIFSLNKLSLNKNKDIGKFYGNDQELLEKETIKKDHFYNLKIKENIIRNENEYKLKFEGFYLNLFVLFIFSLLLINFGRNSISSLTNQYLSSPSGFYLSSKMLSFIITFYSLGLFIMGLFIKNVIKKFNDYYLFNFGILFALIYLLLYLFSKNIILIFVANFLSWGVASTLITAPIADFIIKSGKKDIEGYKGAFLSSIFILILGVLLYVVFFKKNKMIKNKS